LFYLEVSKCSPTSVLDAPFLNCFYKFPGHSQAISSQHYGLTDTHGNIPSDTMTRFGMGCEIYHNSIGLGPTRLRPSPLSSKEKFINTALHKLASNPDVHEQMQVMAKDTMNANAQFLASQEQMLVKIEQRLTANVKGTVEEAFAELVARLEDRWQGQPGPTRPSLVPAAQSPVDAQQQPPINPLTALKTLFRCDNVSFRSTEQELMADCVLNRNHCLIVVLPTGEGKSLAWLLPAAMTDAQSNIFYLVTVPLLTLLENHIAEAKKFGIAAMHWTPESGTMYIPMKIRLVFMSTDRSIAQSTLNK
jgi:hypothetical protein